MIAALLCVIVVGGIAALVAAKDADTDARDILAGRPIRHMQQWAEIAMLMAVVIMVTDAVGVYVGGVRPLTIVPLCAVAYGTFTPLNRMWLNRWRGMPFDYLSRSNLYDRSWLWLFGGNVQAAACAAYDTEVIVGAGGAFVALMINL